MMNLPKSISSISIRANERILVFVDARVEHYQYLISGIKLDTKALILHQQEDGVKQITQILSEYSDVESIHIVSHGAPGKIYLGNTELSLDTLKDYNRELQTWFERIPEDAKPALVLYGCNVAAGDAGTEFLEKLHQLTEATIYASSTLVGNSMRGGNWNLDVRKGEVPDLLSLVFQSQVLETYSGVFTTGSDGNYTFYDSKEGSKGTVAFENISTNGTNIRENKSFENDWLEKDISLGLDFSFKFYDQTFDKISISDNGYITFIAANPVNSQNGNLPRGNQTYSIFPFWDDFKATEVFYKQESNRFIVQWNNVKHSDTDEDATFQVVLYKNSNNIDFVYQDVLLGDSSLNYGQSATIGINKDNPSALKYSYNGKDSSNISRNLNGVTSIRFLTEPKLLKSQITVKERDITLSETQTITLTKDNFEATDVDNTSSLANIKFKISDLQHGQFLLNGISVTEFSQQDINNGNVKFVHDGGEDAPSFTVIVTDGYNSTASQSINKNSVTATSGIIFSNLNDNPVLSGLTPSVDFKENSLNQAASLLYNNITLTDVDSSSLNGGNLTVSYNNTSEAKDQLSIQNNGLLTVNGNIVKYNGAEIGTIDGTNNGSNGKDLVVNFTNINATPAATKALIESLAYQTTSDTPKPSRTISITVKDGGGFGDPNSKPSNKLTTQINVTSENDAPINNIPTQAITIDEDTPFTFSNHQIFIFDPDAGNSAVQVTLTATNGTLSLSGIGIDKLNFSDANGIDGTLKFTGSIADINNALNSLTFTSALNSNNINTNITSLAIDTQDLGNSGTLGGNQTDIDTINFNVIPVNDAPVNQLTKTAVNINEDTNLIFSTANGNAISISDVDAAEGTNEIEVTVAVAKGLLSLTNTTGITFTKNNATINTAMTFKGKVADVNNALEGLTYKGNQNYNGADTLTITTNDLGNTGKTTALTDKDEIAITVNPVNDAPINTVPATQTYDTNRDLIFSSANNNAISISDIDAFEGTGEVEVKLSVTNGKLIVKNTTGITFTQNSANGNASITLRGQLTNINQALNGLIYRGNQEYKGQDILKVVTSDLGNWGQGDVLNHEDKINILVSDLDTDGINNTTEAEIASEITKQASTDTKLNSLSQRAANEAGVVALYGADGGTTRPILLAINDEDQQRLTGDYPNFALVINDVNTKPFETDISNPIAVFDAQDLRKSALKEVEGALDIINFQVKSNPAIADKNRQQQIQENIKTKTVRVEIKLPDDIPVNAILQRRNDGTLYDLRRSLNLQWNNLDYDSLSGAVLQDRNLDGKPDWAIVYLQDGQWGDEDGAVNGEIAQSLVAVNLDLGTSHLAVRSSQDGLNFYGNRSFVQFTLNHFSAKEASEIGMARVRFGENGQIIQVNGKKVNSLEEARQAILLRGETLFNSLTNKRNPDFGSQTCTLAFEEGEQAVFFSIQGGTRDELRSNGLSSKPVQFSLSSLNGGTTTFQASSDTNGQTAKLSLAGFDINAKILTSEELKPQLGLLAINQKDTEFNPSDELIDLKSSGAFDDKQVMLKFSLQREASFNNSAYFYRVDDTKGSIKDPLTGMQIDPTAITNIEQRQRYLELATGERLVQGAQFSTSNFTNKEVVVNVSGGEYYAPFLVADGTLSSISNDFSRIFTCYMGINSDGADHIRSLGDGIFGFEDSVGSKSDRDYNDMILSIKQVQITA
ncbi:DUF4347 domain-containing protein [Nostoc sp.]|uniref:DUF4347 domain-containing protein n=1 Tax=Nostoc sp. TaxID=1180 RepID=UPI002FF75099